MRQNLWKVFYIVIKKAKQDPPGGGKPGGLALYGVFEDVLLWLVFK